MTRRDLQLAMRERVALGSRQGFRRLRTLRGNQPAGILVTRRRCHLAKS